MGKSGVADAILGWRIMTLRKAAGKTQQELADALGVSRPTVTTIELGDRMVRSNELPVIAAFLNLTVADLLCEDAPEWNEEDRDQARLRRIFLSLKSLRRQMLLEIAEGFLVKQQEEGGQKEAQQYDR